VDKVAPVLLSVAGVQNQTTGVVTLTAPLPINEPLGFAAAEFWLGTTTPSAGTATRVPVSVVGTTIVATVPLAGLPSGSQRFNLRVQDMAGNWSNAVNTTVTVRPNTIFASGFTVFTGQFGWSAVTGNPSVTAAAGIPVGGTNRGLLVNEAGGGGNAVRYVTDNSPTAETNYHASFAFNANTLNAGANVLTLFEARTNTAQVFAVQFRKNAGVNQIGTVMSGSIAPVAWIDLPVGPHTIRVDWAAAVTGSLQLQLDGVPAPTLTRNANTNALRVEAARLGLTAGVTNAVAGASFFDSFSSTRYTLP